MTKRDMRVINVSVNVVLSSTFKKITMHFKAWNVFVFCLCVGTVLSADVFQSPTVDSCVPAPLGRIDWILHVRQRNYGWGANTHRANIALAVNKWQGPIDDIAKMRLQLEDEITTALMRSSQIDETDLALFIHALIATQKNPRDFHGIDLVADLLHRVDSDPDVHPFLVLALCNSHAVEQVHLKKIMRYTVHSDVNTTLETREIGRKALALKALACAATLPDAQSKKLVGFQRSMEEAANCLISKQVDGVFGNPYATSLAVQALTAYGKASWNREKSLEYLRKESVKDVNIVKAYYVEMALNSHNVTFIKDLYPGPYDPVVRVPTREYFTTYTIKDEQDPDTYFSVIMKIPFGWDFFTVMEKASSLSNRFEFSHFMNKDGDPVVYRVIGKPNDAELNMFWRICRQRNVQHDPHTSNVTTFSHSPARFAPEEKEHVIVWYRSTPCPSS